MVLVIIRIYIGNYDAQSKCSIKPYPESIVVNQGDYDPRQTKVLHYSVNPFSTAQRKLTTELEQLREENRRLTKRLQLIEESRGAALSDLSARVDSELHASSGKEVEGIMKYGGYMYYCCYLDARLLRYITLH